MTRWRLRSGSSRCGALPKRHSTAYSAGGRARGGCAAARGRRDSTLRAGARCVVTLSRLARAPQRSPPRSRSTALGRVNTKDASTNAVNGAQSKARGAARVIHFGPGHGIANHSDTGRNRCGLQRGHGPKKTRFDAPDGVKHCTRRFRRIHRPRELEIRFLARRCNLP